MTDSASHHRDVIDVSIDDHRLDRVVGIARRKLVFDMIVPARRERLLCGRETCAGEMVDEELEAAQVRELRGGCVLMFAAATTECAVCATACTSVTIACLSSSLSPILSSWRWDLPARAGSGSTICAGNH